MKPSVMYRALLPTVLLVSSVSLFGQQADPTARAAAEKLFVVLKADRNAEQIVQVMMKTQESMVASQSISEEQKKRLMDGMKVLAETMMKPLMEKTKELYVDAYAATFTAKELEELVDFYQSPVGQKLVDKQPQMIADVMQSSMALAQSLMPEMQRKMQEVMRQELEGNRKD
jgi:hypothetical protein